MSGRKVAPGAFLGWPKPDFTKTNGLIPVIIQDSSTLQVLMLYSVIPGWFRMPLVIIVTFAITMITYHYFVRYTIIGEYLHGKRIRPSKPRL